MPELADTIAFTAMAATGNRFAVVEARALASGIDPGSVAGELCAGRATAGPREARGGFDGLLVVAPARGQLDCSMEVWNADGSRARACGNGLRIVAKYWGERVARNRAVLRIQCASGVSAARLVRESGRVVAATVSLGRARSRPLGVCVGLGARTLDPDWIDTGNLHAVLFAPAASPDELETVGPLVERSVPDGANVELARRTGPSAWHVRVWERGVGETASCGSGACAVAAAARARGWAEREVDITFPGGALRVSWSESGESLLSGSCEELGSGTHLLVR